MLLGQALVLMALAFCFAVPAPAVADDQVGATNDQAVSAVAPEESVAPDGEVAVAEEGEPAEVPAEGTSTAETAADAQADESSAEQGEAETAAGDATDSALDELPAGAPADEAAEDTVGLAAKSAAEKLIGKTFAVKSKKNASFVLGIKGSSIDRLATTEIQAPSSALSQRWHFVDAGDGFVRIINLGSGLALDVSYSKANKGQVIWQYIDNGSVAQRWYPVEVSAGSYVFVSAVGGVGAESTWYVLDVYAGTMKAGQAVKLWSYNKSVAQQWTLTEDTSERVVVAQDIKAFASKNAGTLADGQSVVLAPRSGGFLVLDVAGGSTANKANVQGYTSNASDAQTWTVRTDKDGFVTLINKKSGKALDIANGAGKPGANIWQYNPNGSMAQKWVAAKASDGSVTLWSALGRGLVIDMTAGGTAKGTNVRVWTSNGSAAQRFAVVEPTTVAPAGKTIDNGYYSIALSDGSFVVDVKGGSRAAGTAAQLYTANGSLSQLFYITYCVTDGYYRIQSVLSHQNLSIGSNLLPDAPVMQLGIDASSKGQCWNIVKSGSSYQIVSALSGKPLSANAATKGTNLAVSDSASKATWNFEVSEPSIATGAYKIVSALDYSTVLEVANGSVANGAQIQAAKNGSGYEQRFYIAKQSDGTYTIESIATFKALSSATSGKVVQQTVSSDSSQRWKLQYTPFGYKFVSASTSKAISLGATNAGTKATQVDGRAAGQSFYVSATKLYDAGCHQLVTAINSSHVADVTAGSVDNGANVQLWGNNGSPAQKWQIKDAGNGYVSITDVKSGLVLGVKGNSATKGANVEQQTPSSANGQKWKLEYTSGGFKITSALSASLVLDVSGAKAANGANLQIWTSNNSVAQKWLLNKTSAGVIIGLDPGHGGDDSGAVGNGMREADLTWNITQACATQLRAYGFTVYVTKAKSESVTISERVNRAYNHGASCVVSIHIDAGGGNGAQVLVPNASSFHHEFYTMGQEFARNLNARFRALGLGTHGDGAYERNYSYADGAEENRYYTGGGLQDYYGIVRYARLKGMFGVIIEHGFIDSSDANLLRQSSFQTALGKADAAAIRDLYN